ncbi:hypothetical protein EDB87DRAFT_1639237 [Lactarius vividus]|nr:hypothetical protein EDB87DRAFT_1639237 [Lactarius vividus]
MRGRGRRRAVVVLISYVTHGAGIRCHISKYSPPIFNFLSLLSDSSSGAISHGPHEDLKVTGYKGRYRFQVRA